jgi:hypothetical protein
LLKKSGKIEHDEEFFLEVLRNFFEFADRVFGLARSMRHCVFQAMVDVVMHQRLLGIGHGLFDRLQLLGDFKATTAVLEHLDDALEVTIGPFEAFDNFWVRSMGSHGPYAIPLEGIWQEPVLEPAKGDFYVIFS